MYRAHRFVVLELRGPFHFARPNDGAIGALPPDILNTFLTNNEFIPHLLDLLLLHAVVDTFLASDLMLAPVIFGLNGEEVFIDFSPSLISDLCPFWKRVRIALKYKNYITTLCQVTCLDEG
jgi:hypothetical protein